MLTEAQTDPWWRVDLEAPKQISDLKIHTRNADQRRLAGYRILVSSTINISDAVECYAAPAGVAPPEAGLVGCKASGQYVWIQVKGDGKYVQVCEVEVYPPESAVCVSDPECADNTVCTRTGGSDTCSACISGTYSDGDSCEELPNLARSCGPTGSDACFATQSSQYGVFEASRAVDGGTNRDIQAGSCMLTVAEPSPFFVTDLGSIRAISYVRIYTRNSDQRRLAGFRVFLSNTPDFIDAVDSECYAAPAGVAPPEAAEVLCEASGRYLWINTPGTYVQLCEVEVYPPSSAVCLPEMVCPGNSTCTRTADGHSCTCIPGFTGFVSDGSATGACIPLPNLARSCGPAGSENCVAMQSSQYGVFEASRAVDGGTNGDIQAGSCMLTSAQTDPWWRVDLGATKQISSVKIYNRNADQGRLAGFSVRVSDTTDITNAAQCFLASPYTPPSVAEVQCEAVGRYVWIVAEGESRYLQMCEVEVYPPRIENPLAFSGASCTVDMISQCQPNSVCSRDGDNFTCTCLSGYKAEGDTCIDVNECLLEPSPCHYLAYCDDGVGMFKCTCPEGFLGDGFHCQSEAFAVRSVFNFADVSGLDTDQVKLAYARAITNDFGDGVYNLTLESPIVETAHVEVYATGKQLTINALFYTEELAKQVLEQMPNTTDLAAEVGATLLVGAPEVYRWMGRSTSDPYQVRPSGFTVETVYFDPSRLQSGCWVVEVVYTTGTDDFNAFYLPEAVGNDQLSYDFDYSATDATWPQSAEDTFSPVTHPCTTADYDASSSGLVAQASSCCLAQFIDMYRPIASFVSDVNGTYGSGCQVGGARNRPLASSDVREFEIGDLAGDGGGPDGTYVNGLFSGLSYSYGESAGVIDPYVGIYKATFYLDEVELRRKAGILKGTVGVEHTTDTFLGLINLSPTGRPVLDTFATQTAIHLEKTSYFSVSTHGVNAYTFLQYVNMRLVAIYNEDKDFSGVDESTLTTVRTDPSLAAHYVQVTFTLGSKYGVNENSGLVPLDSVRAGKGTFFNSANLQHKCLEWTGATDYSFASQDAFNTTLVQECGPGATMCDSPASIPDQFASFNIPLGVDFLPEASPTLSNNIFVDFVVSAIDLEAKGAKAGNADAPTNPSAGEAPWQMKTTLTGSIPVVQGGVNIFCDGITGKTDLKDVANVDIVVGSCDSAAELTRLRIKKDIASTQLAPDAITEINSDSIEAGLMTLVLKGNGSYFADNVGIQGVSLELEDLITVHIMQDDGTGADASVVSSVMALVTADPADNSDSSGLITNGYALNGAVFFTVDRASQRAHLEPSQELLELCPFNPPRPEPGNSPLETCVLRRDVRYRDYPWRNGAKSTAMELCANVGGNKQGLDGAQCPSSTSSDESLFFASILGNSDYAKQLAIDYAAVIADAYALNGRYRRAYWINPGYEWTPTQTGGASVFSISQKLFLFALVTLDEGISGSVGKTITDSTQFASNGPKLSRRMLLQSASDGLVDAQASVGADAFEFSVTPKSMMAQAFGVPEDRVALFVVELQLTAAEACMAPVQRQKAIQTTFVDYLSTTASSLHTVQVVSMAVDMGGESCSGERRRLRKLLAGYSAATASVEMMLVFTAGSEAFFDPEGFSKMAGIAGVEADARNSPKISTTHLDCTAVDCGVVTEGRSEDAESGSDKTALIAGIAGGAGGLGLLVGAALLFKHSRKRHMEEIPAVHAVNVADLKAQLQENV